MGDSMRRVYLSGGMEYAPDEGRDWRGLMHEWLERELGCEVFNPNRESDRFLSQEAPGVDMRAVKFTDLDAFRALVTRLVDLDCREIATRSDYVICYWDESAMRGAGTKGELTMARYFGKPVYLVTSIPHHEIPGWVLGCTTRIFTGFQELQEYLKQRR